MNKQIILCVEANRRAQTDNIYIKETITNFYKLDNKTRLSFANMNGKTNYRSRDVLSQIARYTKDYKIGNTSVIYCIDLDNYESDPAQVKLNEEIKSYINDKGYEIIWFCRDIEEVYLGHSVGKSEKLSKAAEFKKRELIQGISTKSLNLTRESKGKSNILMVLDRYLERK